MEQKSVEMLPEDREWWCRSDVQRKVIP